MFGSDRIVVIENLFSRKKSNEQTDILKYTKAYIGDTDIIFWEKKAVGKIAQRSLPEKTNIKEFKTPVLIFKLVEQLDPLNKKLVLETYEKAVLTEAPEFIFAMLVRQVKLLLQLKLGKTPAGAPWMIGKLKSQASKFTQTQLETAYKKLYQIDKQIKTGATPMNMDWHLGFWLANL